MQLIDDPACGGIDALAFGRGRHAPLVADQQRRSDACLEDADGLAQPLGCDADQFRSGPSRTGFLDTGEIGEVSEVEVHSDFRKSVVMVFETSELFRGHYRAAQVATIGQDPKKSLKLLIATSLFAAAAAPPVAAQSTTEAGYDGTFASTACELRPQPNQDGSMGEWWLTRVVVLDDNKIEAVFTTYVGPGCDVPLNELLIGGDIGTLGRA
ncbi:MAG: hypothetical protein AAFR47_17905, partial [Pseudomonadota bacterium]